VPGFHFITRSVEHRGASVAGLKIKARRHDKLISCRYATGASASAGQAFAVAEFRRRPQILGSPIVGRARFGIQRAQHHHGQPTEVREVHGVKIALVTDPEGHLTEVVELLAQ